MISNCVFVRTFDGVPVVICNSQMKKEACLIYSNCPTCRRWPEYSSHVVFQCWACGMLCCDACMSKSVYVAYCPHCGSPATLKPIGRSKNCLM